jgi:pimeloyl-ACP methyl ester carboxylesterase
MDIDVIISELQIGQLKTVCRQGRHHLTDREAVVFVHGNPGSGEDWTDLLAALAPVGRVVALDMPGFGRADKPSDYPYSVESGAQFLDQALSGLGIDRAHLVLHDFGGPWGLQWAAQNLGKVASITLVNTGLLMDYQWHLMARIWRTPILGELQQMLTNRSGFHWAIRWGCPRGLPDAFVNRMYDDLDKGTKRAILKLYRATSDIGPRSHALADQLGDLKVPVLVVWGAADPYLPVRYAEMQKEVFARAKVVMLPDSGHFPFADNPQGVLDAVVPFLQSGRPRNTKGSVSKTY